MRSGVLRKTREAQSKARRERVALHQQLVFWTTTLTMCLVVSQTLSNDSPILPSRQSLHTVEMSSAILTKSKEAVVDALSRATEALQVNSADDAKTSSKQPDEPIESETCVHKRLTMALSYQCHDSSTNFECSARPAKILRRRSNRI